MMGYTTIGQVCGGCGHHHRTLESAYRCADKHHKAVQKHNGSNAYSDRQVVHFNGSRLTEDEHEDLMMIQERIING